MRCWSAKWPWSCRRTDPVGNGTTKAATAGPSQVPVSTLTENRALLARTPSSPALGARGAPAYDLRHLEELGKKAATHRDDIEYRPRTVLESGIVYTGGWRLNRKEGYGIQEWPDGARFEGYWSEGQANGEGVFLHADGDLYQGQWVNDRANGYGEYYHKDGSTYKGGWKDDRKHGQALENWADGSSFQGCYYNGKKHGKGKFAWPDGSRYEGDFKDNEISGEGQYTWSDGRTYTGSWSRNRMNGFGTFRWPDGRYYVGSYVNDKKHGYGEFYWTDMRAYCGGWRDGRQDGLGTFISRSGERRGGIWREGVRLRWLDHDEVSGGMMHEPENGAPAGGSPDARERVRPDALADAKEVTSATEAPGGARSPSSALDYHPTSPGDNKLSPVAGSKPE